MINRLSNVSRNAFDNLIITATLGLTATAIYGNYYLIYTAVFSVTAVFSDSMQASVGNSIAVRSEAQNFENLLDFSMLYAWIAGWCATTMACLYQPFMKLWVGQELMLSDGNMLLFAVYFYLISMNHIRNQYILGNALWWDLKWVYLIEAAANLLLNLVLGHFWGVTGVLLATILTIFFCNYLMCNAVLFRRYFRHASIGLFYRQQFYYLLCTAVVCGGVYLICRRTDSIFLRAGICIVLPNLLYLLLFRPCSRWKSSTAIVRRLLNIK
jgi:O-antigen/teichoic acid export membrane protein